MATFVATAGTAATVATSITPALPAGWAAGDLVLIAILGKYRSADCDTPAGWTSITGRIQHSITTTGNDTGNVFAKVYGRVMQAGDTAPTFTATATVNSWEAIAEAWRPAAGNAWTDAADLAGIPWVTFDDATTADPLTGSATFATQPAAADGAQLTMFGVIPTDTGTAQGAVTASATGLSGGTVTARQYVENALGGDTAGLSWTWTGFTGTATGALAWSTAITSSTNSVGLGVALWLREAAAATQVAPADTGSGADTMTTAATVGPADTATGSGSMTVTAQVAMADAAAAADSMTVTLPPTQVAPADTAASTDSLAVAAQLAPADTGSGAAQTLTVTATAALSDNVSAAQALAVAAQAPLADSAAAADVASLAATLALADAAQGVDSMAVAQGAVPVALTDSAVGTGQLAVTAQLAPADSAAATQQLALVATQALAEQAAAADLLALAAATGLADAAQAADTMTVTVGALAEPPTEGPGRTSGVARSGRTTDTLGGRTANLSAPGRTGGAL